MIIPKKIKHLQLFFEFDFLKNDSICRFQMLFGYSPNPFGGNDVSDFLFISWFLFYDKNRKISYKLKKNHFLNNIKEKLGPRRKI